MALIDTDTWISQYWDKVEENYPNIDFPHFTTICKSPFRYIRRQMAKPTLPLILIKYLGKLRVFPVTINKMMKEQDKKAKFGDITEEERQLRITELQLTLERLLAPPKPKKHANRQIIFIEDKETL